MMIGKWAGKDKKETKETVEQERNLLKITLEHLAQENAILKRQVEDMKVTVKTNKELLKEYVEKITNKDKVVEKMNNTIEQLQSRLYSLEEYIRNANGTGYTSGSKTNRVSNNKLKGILNSNPINKTNYKLSDNENITNENEVPETRDVTGISSNLYNEKRRSNTFRKEYGVIKTKNDDRDVKEFFFRQNKFFEEIHFIKNEISLLLNDKKILNKLTQDIQNENSEISDDSMSNLEKYTHINLKENFEQNDVSEKSYLELILSNSEKNCNHNLLLFVDNMNNIWELVRRFDLKINNLNSDKYKELKSINTIISENNFLREFEKSEVPLIEVDNTSMNNSDLELSKMTEFNGSNIVKETLNEFSELF